MITNYDADRRKLDLRDFNEIIDHVNSSPMSYNGHNSESFPQGISQGGNSKYRWTAFQLQTIGTGTIAVRQSRWWRNGNKSCPAEIQNALSVSTGQYELDYKFTPVGYGTGDYSTSTDGTEYNGMIYYVACLDSSTSTSNYDDYATWNAATFDADPAMYPNRYHICKVKEEDIGDLYSGVPSHMDSCKRIIGSVKMAENAFPLEKYQYISQDINDQLDAHSWDCFKMSGSSFYMLPGYLYVNGETTGPYYTPATTTTVNGITVYNVTLTTSATNYIYAEYRCVGAGTPSIGVTTVAGNADSDGDAFRKLLWTITLDADAKVSSHRRHQMEDIMYWEVVSEIYWDRGSSGKIEYRIPNCTSYFEVAQAEDCP